MDSCKQSDVLFSNAEKKKNTLKSGTKNERVQPLP